MTLSNGNNRKEVHSILEIRLGKGIMPNESSYSAVDVIENLSQKLTPKDR